MAQQLLTSLVALDPTVENWDAGLQAIITAVKEALRTFSLTIVSQGDTGIQSQVVIQLVDAMGEELNEQVILRIRVCIKNAYVVQPNATIAVVTGTLLESVTATKDIVVQSDADGKVVISVTDTTEEEFTLMLGHWLTTPFADFTPTLNIAHAVPLGLVNAMNDPIFNVGALRLVHG